MHSHGLPSVHVAPASGNLDPATNPNVAMEVDGLAIESANGNSPQFQSAFKSCQHLMGLRLGVGKETHQEFLTALKTAKCMRAHGYPNWPDPQANSPGVYIPPNVDMNAPQFRAVAKTCGYPVLHGG
jgi:hypothetical protein